MLEPSSQSGSPLSTLHGIGGPRTALGRNADLRSAVSQTSSLHAVRRSPAAEREPERLSEREAGRPQAAIQQTGGLRYAQGPLTARQFGVRSRGPVALRHARSAIAKGKAQRSAPTLLLRFRGAGESLFTAVVKETFVGEGIEAEETSFCASSMAMGKPGLPRKFSWRDRSFSVGQILEEWKESGDCRHGSGERYVRKHWFRIQTTEGLEMKIYCERQGRSSGGSRWRLYSMRKVE